MSAALGAIGLMMGDENTRSAATLLSEHATVLGRVAMALLGDSSQVERALEQVAREAGTAKTPPANVTNPLAWLLGLVRGACATQMSKLPLRTRTQGFESGREQPSPNTERLGASEAMPARAQLAGLKPTEREAVVLSLVGGLEAADIAVACNIDVGTAKTRLARGVEQLLLASSSSASSSKGGAT